MSEEIKYTIIGGGSWATSICKILCDNPKPKKVTWWVRTQQKAEYIRQYKHNPDYISSIAFNASFLSITHLLQDAISQSDYIILAIPSAFIHQQLSVLSASDFEGKKVVSAVKGLVPETHQVLHDYLQTQFGVETKNIGYITGPCHAEEVALERLSYLTIASENGQLSHQMAKNLSCRFIKVSTSEDITGAEYSSVLKNVYAIAAGICHGMGYGDNFLSVLVSNAIRETERFLDRLSPLERNINDSAYLGDLLVTAYSTFSRNRTFGNMLGKGYSVKAAQMEMNMVAEGYYACKSMYKLNEKLGVHMPILAFTNQVVYKGIAARKAASEFVDTLN